MRKKGYYILLLTAVIALAGCNNNTSEPANPSTSTTSSIETSTENTETATQQTTTNDPLAAATPVKVVVQNDKESYSTTPNDAKDISNSPAQQQIQKLIESVAVTLDDNGNFNPKEPITRSQFIQWMYGYDNKEIKLKNNPNASFDDVASDNPDYLLIEGLYTSGVITGFPDGTMKLNKSLTREELTLLWGWYQSDGDVVDSAVSPEIHLQALKNYSDYKKIGHIFIDAVYRYGANDDSEYTNVFGKNNKLQPQQAVTREQAAKWIVDYTKIEDREEEDTDDVKANFETSASTTVTVTDLSHNIAQNDIVNLLSSGAASVDTNGHFNPNDFITRRDFIEWMYRYHPIEESTPLTEFTPFVDVAENDPDYALIQKLQQTDQIVGFDDHSLKLDQPLTREQLCLLWTAYTNISSLKDPIVSPSVTQTNLLNYIDGKEVGKDYKNKEFYQQAVLPFLIGDREYRQVFGYVPHIQPQAEVSRAEAAQWIVKFTDKDD